MRLHSRLLISSSSPYLLAALLTTQLSACKWAVFNDQQLNGELTVISKKPITLTDSNKKTITLQDGPAIIQIQSRQIRIENGAQVGNFNIKQKAVSGTSLDKLKISGKISKLPVDIVSELQSTEHLPKNSTLTRACSIETFLGIKDDKTCSSGKAVASNCSWGTETIVTHSDTLTKHYAISFTEKGQSDHVLATFMATLNVNGKQSQTSSGCVDDGKAPVVCHQQCVSNNYTAVMMNDDGSYSVKEPMFKSQNGNNLPISGSSDTSRNGLCKLFGFNRAIENSVRYTSNVFPSEVVINKDAQFASYDDSQSHYAISSIVCTNDVKDVSPSLNYSSLAPNDDGSVTLLKPLFKSPNISNLHISSSSSTSRSGVCKLFGYAEFVPNSERYTSNTFPSEITIDKNGKFSGYDDSQQYYAISSIACTNKPTNVPPSTNYSLLGANDDGTMTIIRPQFKSPNGTNLPISGSSDTSRIGVCNLFGFPEFVVNSERYTSNVFATEVVIGREGAFSSFDDSQRHYALSSIVCSKPGVSYPASNNYSSQTLNDDGTVTILGPQFKSPDGHNLPISGSSDTSRPGICKLFGFSGFVPNSERYTSNVFSSEIVISPNGKFLRFDDSQRHYGIASLICTK